MTIHRLHRTTFYDRKTNTIASPDVIEAFRDEEIDMGETDFCLDYVEKATEDLSLSMYDSELLAMAVSEHWDNEYYRTFTHPRLIARMQKFLETYRVQIQIWDDPSEIQAHLYDDESTNSYDMYSVDEL